MNKKQNNVRLTIDKDEVKHMIKEAYGRAVENNSVVAKLQQALDLVNEVTKSGYIPFTSPAPSSTEQDVKNAILNAQNYLMMALNKTKSLYN